MQSWLPLHKGGVGAGLACTSDNNVGATIAVGAIRLWIMPKRLLQQLGYESADKTAAGRYRDTAVNQLPLSVAKLPSP